MPAIQQILSVGINPSVPQTWLLSNSELSSWTDVFSMPHISSSPRTPAPPRRDLLAGRNWTRSLQQPFQHFQSLVTILKNSLSPWEPDYSQRAAHSPDPSSHIPNSFKDQPSKTVDKGLLRVTQGTHTWSYTCPFSRFCLWLQAGPLAQGKLSPIRQMPWY